MEAVEKDSPISAASLRRQIEREGRRWGLVADFGQDELRFLAEALVEAQAGTWSVTMPSGQTVQMEIDEDMVLKHVEALTSAPVVGVARVDHEAFVQHGVGEIRRGQRIRLCSVDDEHPFSASLANRVNNGEIDLAARARAGRQQRKKEQAEAREEKRREARALWRTRLSIKVLPTGIVPAGLRERARRNGG